MARRGAKRAARPSLGLAWLVTWPLTLVFAAMVFFTATGIHRPTREVSGTMEAADWEARLPERMEAVHGALLKAPLAIGEPREEDKGSGPMRWTHRRYDIQLPRAQQQEAEAAIQTLRGVDPGVTITSEATFNGTVVQVGLDGLLIHTLRFQWEGIPSGPRVAVVIDSLGDDLRLAREVVSLDAPIALGVRPCRPFSTQVAELGRLFERDVLIDWQHSGAGEVGPAERDLDAALACVPGAIGLTSAGRADGAAAELLAELEKRGLLYLEVTEPDAQGGFETPTRAVPVPVFVFAAGAEPGVVDSQLIALISEARERGTAIGVGKQAPVALAALRRALPHWRAADIDVVPLTALLSAASGER